MTTTRERIYLRNTGRTTVCDEDYLIWFNAAKRRAMHQRDLFNPNGTIKNEDAFLRHLRMHYPARDKV